jgi:hypothetical protein
MSCLCKKPTSLFQLQFEIFVQENIMTYFRIDDIVVADGPWMFPETSKSIIE